MLLQAGLHFTRDCDSVSGETTRLEAAPSKTRCSSFIPNQQLHFGILQNTEPQSLWHSRFIIAVNAAQFLFFDAAVWPKAGVIDMPVVHKTPLMRPFTRNYLIT